MRKIQANSYPVSYEAYKHQPAPKNTVTQDEKMCHTENETER